MSWRLVKLETIAMREPHSLIGGPFGSKLTSADYVSEGIPVIRGLNLTGGRYLNEREFVYVTEQKMRKDLSANLAFPGDIVFTQRGTLGQVAIIPKDSRFRVYVISQSQMKLTVDSEKADSTFIYYYFTSRETINKIINQTSSSGVPHINLTTLRNFAIQLPPLGYQQEISSILASYDDLIENNTRQIQLLEEAARQLYKEWFVRLQFPGHEQVKVVDGVPKGWEQIAIENALTLQRGFDLPIQARKDGNVPIYGSTGIVGHHNQAKVNAPGVVTGRSGTLGQVHYAHDDYWPLNTSLWVKEFKRVSPFFAFFLLRELDLKKYNGGVSVPTLDRNVVHRIECFIPPSMLINEFDSFAGGIFAQIKKLTLMNQKLQEARDLLLPRLMSGEIRV